MLVLQTRVGFANLTYTRPAARKIFARRLIFGLYTLSQPVAHLEKSHFQAINIFSQVFVV